MNTNTMTISTSITCALALGFGILATGAHATPLPASSASASLSNFNYQLIDLNLADEVTPFISFEIYSYGNLTQLSDLSAGQSQYELPTFPANNAIESTSRSSNTINTSATGVLTSGTGSYGFIGSGITSTGSAVGGASLEEGVNSYSSRSFLITHLSTFTLSANTLVIFSANATVQSQVNNIVRVFDGATDYANASAYLQVSGLGGAAWQDATSTVDAYAYADETFSSRSGNLSVSFSNASASISTGNLNARAIVEGNIAVTAVPEPETYAMLLAGLGLVGAVTRRNSAKAEAACA